MDSIKKHLGTIPASSPILRFITYLGTLMIVVTCTLVTRGVDLPLALSSSRYNTNDKRKVNNSVWGLNDFYYVRSDTVFFLFTFRKKKSVFWKKQKFLQKTKYKFILPKARSMTCCGQLLGYKVIREVIKSAEFQRGGNNPLYRITNETLFNIVSHVQDLTAI